MNKGQAASYSSRSARISAWLSFLTFVLGLLIASEWVYDGLQVLPRFGLRMRFNSSVCFTCFGLSLWLLLTPNLMRGQKWLQKALALFPLVLAVVTLLEYVLNLNFGIDQLIVHDYQVQISHDLPGRMAPNASMCVAILGLSILLLGRGTGANRLAKRLVGFTGALALLALMGHVFDAQALYRSSQFIGMSIASAALIFNLSLVVSLFPPQIGFVEVILSEGAVGAFARRMASAAILFPVVIGWGGRLVWELGITSDPLASAVTAAGTALAFVFLVWWSAKALRGSEQALHDSEIQLRTMVNSIPQLAWISDSTGSISWYNQRWYDYTGASAESMLGHGWKSVHSPDHVNRVVKKFSAALQSGEVWEDVFPLRARDGSYRRFLSRAMPIRNEAGEIIRWFGTNTDIEDQQQAEQALRESRARFATLTEAIPHLVWTSLPDGNVDYISKQWVEFTGIPVELQLGKNWLRVLHPEDREKVAAKWDGAVAGAHPYDIEYRIRGQSGEYRWFRARGTPVKDFSGQITYWFGTCTDIHEHRLTSNELVEAKEIAEQANLAKTQFLANMSHEIRTPVGVIMGFVDLLKSIKNLPSEHHEYTQIVERNSKNLLRLIDDLLDLSKVEAGKIAIEQTDFCFPEFLADFKSVMVMKAGEKAIGFDLKVDGQIPYKIRADQLRLRQILFNIVGNAIKFTDQGTVQLQVRFQPPQIEFRVSDTGPGIAPENVARLFKPFSQADPSMTRKYGGSGLGLVLSRRLSEVLGGTLYLSETKLGFGSTFVATIVPEAVSDERLVGQDALRIDPPTEEKRVNGEDRFKGLKVLVVEDSPDNQTLIQLYLRGTGAEVSVAEDGRSGYDLAIKEQPDLILMDIQMPKMDGHQTTESLRRAGFLKPIIALTAHAMREERERCFDSGFNDYLTKPVHRHLLLETIFKFSRGAKRDLGAASWTEKPPSGLS